ncbi:hypothetical protein ACH4C6_13555 [Streptomyces sp. NPDC017943]|uniref:hypothetical protein n=1 Tax=Streptomyces sp. NPDC017943 TaxID=3365019 RepID=UPI0037AE78C9
MTSDDAQAALDDIRRRQDQTRHAYARQGFSRPVVLIAASMIFLVCLSFDLPTPWNGAMIVPLALLAAAQWVLHRRSSAVRRRPSAVEQVFALAVTAILIGTFMGLSAAASAAGAPAPHTLAGVVLALASVPGAQWTRSLFEALVRKEGRRG